MFHCIHYKVKYPLQEIMHARITYMQLREWIIHNVYTSPA